MVSSREHVLVGTSATMEAIRAEIGISAALESKVLLTGETGVGKEVVAHEIHRRSRRAAGPFVAINCAGLPDPLLESELFGHVRGSFTGAFNDNPGLLRHGDGGTVFLDEVGEMSLRMQALFLRFLETGEMQTVGSTGPRARINVRLVTATNRPLRTAIARGEFREDLFYRLNVLNLHIPPLRERATDVPLLLDHFARCFARQYDRTKPTFTADAAAMLMNYHWPGNVRELRNVVERLVSRCMDGMIDLEHLPAEVVKSNKPASAADADRESRQPVRVEAMLERMLQQKESFWATAYPMFMTRDLTRDDLRAIVRYGLEQTQGSYRILLTLFNMPEADYKRFLGFLKQHDCHLPFQHFRAASVPPADFRRKRAVGA